MAATKAQLAVWGLITGLSAWGFFALARIELPDEGPAPLPAARVVTAEQVPSAATPKVPALLPATIPEFPFPEEFMTASAEEPRTIAAPRNVDGVVVIPTDAIPEISAFEDAVSDELAELADVAVASISADAPAAVAGEPPIPMPARPLIARPVEAVPLSEVKTLYVVADMLNVRAVPSTAGPVLQRVAQGFAVAPRQRSDEWIGFLMQDGSTGWMRTDYLSDTMPQPVGASAPSTVPAGTEPMNLM